ERQFTLCPPGRLYGDFYVLAERREEIHKALHRESSRLPAHQRGNVGLLNAQYLAGPRLGQAAILNQPVNSQGELGFELFPLRMGEAEISKDVPTPPFDEDSLLLLHLSFAFPGDRVPPPRDAAGSIRFPFEALRCLSSTSFERRAGHKSRPGNGQYRPPGKCFRHLAPQSPKQFVPQNLGVL